MLLTEGVAAKAQILVRRPRAEVFNAFIDPAIMSKFWFRRTDRGLRAGETVTWFVGDGPGAFEIEVHVKSVEPPSRLVVEWGHGDALTTVTWSLVAQSSDVTHLMIEERGFVGLEDDVLSQALDSTGGFNQVIVALKALLEHDSIINVVADHVSTGQASSD